MSKKTYPVNLTEMDIELLLKALGSYQQNIWDHKGNSRPIQYLISKIYRAMGVRL